MLDITFYIFSSFAFFTWTIIIIKFVIVLRNIKWLSIKDRNEKFNSKISVIIPARNEEEDISNSIHSVLNQEKVDLEITVINDHSTDKTGEVIDQIVKSYSNVKVIHNPLLDSKWLGKCNAINHGLSIATGEYILFSDADVIHKPRCFITAVNEFEKKCYDFLSLFPSLVIKPFWENVIIPMYISGVSQLVSTNGIENPNTNDADGTEAFMLIRREVLQKSFHMGSVTNHELKELDHFIYKFVFKH